MNTNKNLRVNPSQILPEAVSKKLLDRAAEIIATQKLGEKDAEIVAQALFQGAAIAAKEAINQRKSAEKITKKYHLQKLDAFKKRLIENPIFTDEELIYSADTLCPCGYGLAYPKDCGFDHYWDCSAILRGIATGDSKHTGQLPFMFYEIKSESVERTTRGVFNPKKSKG